VTSPLVPYDNTREYWEIFAARLAFVIVFEVRVLGPVSLRFRSSFL
jgi:hypothetical protein